MFLLSRTAHETRAQYLKRAAERLEAMGVTDETPRTPSEGKSGFWVKGGYVSNGK